MSARTPPQSAWPCSLDAEELRRRAGVAVDEAQRSLDALLAGTSPPTVEGFLAPLDRILLAVRNVDTHASLMFHTHPEETVRTAGRECSELAGRFFGAFLLNVEAYRRLGALDLEKSDGPTRFAVTKMRREMRRAGVGQDEGGRARLLALSGEIDQLSNRFYENIARWRRTLRVDGPRELEGVPADYLARHPPGPDGTIEIRTEVADSSPVMEYCDNARVRRRLHDLLATRGYPENTEVLAALLRTRHELARTLGYPSYAAYAIEDRMMRTPEAADAFLARVYPYLRPAAQAEYDRLLERKRRDDPAAGRLENWDDTYYTRKLRAESFGMDARRLQQFLPYGAVRDGLFRICTELFGLTFSPVPDAEVWHPSVEAFDVLRDGTLLGRCFLDVAPREGKLRGGGCLLVRHGVRGVQRPEGALVMNLLDPAVPRETDRLDHDKVVGFFHEFGHLVHHLLAGDGAWLYNTFEGLELDFVEAPATLFEEWASDPESLRTFARDPETGEAVPADLVQHVESAGAFGRATYWLFQFSLAHAALRIYSSDPARIDPGDAMAASFRDFFTLPMDPGTHPEASWRHLVGYTACYYSYVWSGVIARDILRPFEERGRLTDPELARRYASEILVPGASRPAEESIRAYLGRDVAYDAFARWVRGPRTAPSRDRGTHG